MLMGCVDEPEENNNDAESNISEGSEVEEEAVADNTPVATRQHDSAQPPPASVQDATTAKNSWARAWRHGPHSDTWTAVLTSFSPQQVLCVRSFQWSAGLLMAVLRYNDSRFGLSRVQFHGFHPHGTADRPSQAKVALAAHIADHMLERVASAYADYRETVNKSIGLRSGRLLKRTASEGGGTVPLASALPLVKGSPGGVAGVPDGDIFVSKFITVPGNFGPRAVLLTKAQELSTEDSDTEPCGGDSACVDNSVLGKRNSAAMEKFGVKISKATANRMGQDVDVGFGVYADRDLAAGTTWPIKGLARGWEPPLLVLRERVRLGLPESRQGGRVRTCLYA